jgi:hypothetical protein
MRTIERLHSMVGLNPLSNNKAAIKREMHFNCSVRDYRYFDKLMGKLSTTAKNKVQTDFRIRSAVLKSNLTMCFAGSGFIDASTPLSLLF